ncbi:MAG: LytTR family DNA-binding domain-containing protein [Bacteroidota bacterium]
MNLLHIPHNRGIRLVKPEQIIRVEALNNYSIIFFDKGQPLTVAKVLHWFEEVLPSAMFARVHRSHLVNKMYMQEISGTNYGTLVLNNGDKISMSWRKKLMV